MLDADFWWERATDYRERACLATDDLEQRREFFELAAVCDEAAQKIESLMSED
jgi:hypothetical protein